MATKYLSRRMDVNGDGTGNADGNGDYSATARVLRLTAQPGEHLLITHMHVAVVDSTFNSLDSYMGAGTLTNGVAVYVTDSDGEVLYDLTDPNHPITTLGEWVHYADQVDTFAGFSVGDKHFVAKWRGGEGGEGIELLPGWSLCVLLQDDFTDLSEHEYYAQGKYIQPRLRDASTEGHL